MRAALHVVVDCCRCRVFARALCVLQVARVGLEELSPGHPFFHTAPSADGVAFFTERCDDSPVVLQAPSPSPTLRASSLFGDLLRLANALGARPTQGR